MSLEHPLSWNDVFEIVKSYHLDKLGRSHEDLEDYRNFKKSLEAQKIGITTNLLIKVLKWLPPDTDMHIPDSESVKLVKYNDPRPFADERDTFITLNDFPYYISNKTLHMLVWIRFPMLPDPNSEIGDIDDDTKRIIEKYVCKTFVDYVGLSRDQIIWWKNYTKIQSIKAIPHVHVLVNLDDDHDGKLEKKLRSLIGTPGVLFDYHTPDNSKL